eukprot:483676-Amphidinium_carterae.1
MVKPMKIPPLRPPVVLHLALQAFVVILTGFANLPGLPPPFLHSRGSMLLISVVLMAVAMVVEMRQHIILVLLLTSYPTLMRPATRTWMSHVASLTISGASFQTLGVAFTSVLR